jgi:hypothetical protein
LPSCLFEEGLSGNRTVTVVIHDRYFPIGDGPTIKTIPGRGATGVARFGAYDSRLIK